MFNQFGGGSVNAFFKNFADFTGDGHFPVTENFRGGRQGFDNPLCRFIKTTVAFVSRTSFRVSVRALSLLGMKPANRKRLVGRPDSCRAQIRAQQPGRTVTKTFCSRALRTSLYPGSEISGEPASLTNAMLLPSLTARLIRFWASSSSL